MIFDLDIWRAANLLIRQHGDDAELAAARRADLMLERRRSRRPNRLETDQSGYRRVASPAERPGLFRHGDMGMPIPNLSQSSVLRLNIHG